MYKDLWRRLPKVVRSLCGLRYVLVKQQPEGTGLRSVVEGHSLALCSHFCLSGTAARHLGSPYLYFKLADRVLCWIPLGSGKSQASSALRHMETATARLLAACACQDTAVCLLSCCEQRYYVSLLSQSILFSEDSPSSLLLLGRSELGSLCWDDEGLVSWIPKWLGGDESSTGPWWTSARSKLFFRLSHWHWKLFITTIKPRQSWKIQELTFCLWKCGLSFQVLLWSLIFFQ